MWCWLVRCVVCRVWAGTLISMLLWTPSLAAQGKESEPGPQPPPKDFASLPRREVRSISEALEVVIADGDQTACVRLIGVHVPRERRAESAAREFLERVLSGESIYIERDPNRPQRDPNDPLWAFIYRAPDGLFVNLELVRQGYARAMLPQLGAHREVFAESEQRARQAGKGLWGRAGPDETPATSRPTANREVDARPTAAPRDDVEVLVTPHGKKYHRPTCAHVKHGATKLALREAQARGYQPCATCKPAE